MRLAVLCATALAFAAPAAQDIAVSPDSIADLPVTTLVLDDHGTQRICEGPRLIDVLARAGIPQGRTLRGRNLTRGVVVEARDGYRVLFSLAELDPLLGRTEAILATQCDGETLDEERGPIRLIVADDARPARAVRQVARIVPFDAADE